MNFNDVVSHVIALMQGINENIDGVQQAPVTAPAQYTTSKMPLALVWEGEQNLSGQIGLSTMMGNFIVEVIMYPSTLGYKEKNFELTRQMGGRFMDTYMALHNDTQDYVLDMGQESEIRVQLDRTQIIKYSGAQTAMEVLPQTAYYGFRLSVPMIARWGGDLL